MRDANCAFRGSLVLNASGESRNHANAHEGATIEAMRPKESASGPGERRVLTGTPLVLGLSPRRSCWRSLAFLIFYDLHPITPQMGACMWIIHARISAIAAETVVLLVCTQTHALVRSSQAGNDDLWNSARIDRYDLPRQFSRDDAALRTSTLWGTGNILQGPYLPPPGISFDRRLLSAQETLLRPQ
jgi:hypothetical protein